MAVVVVGQEEKDKVWRGVAGSALGLVALWRVCCGLRCFPWHEINLVFGKMGRRVMGIAETVSITRWRWRCWGRSMGFVLESGQLSLTIPVDSHSPDLAELS